MKGRGPRPLPLVITHGWPGSVFEMLRLVPLLADPAAHGGSAQDAFDVVVPSIPGYGFSERPRSPGMSNAAVADLWIEMMGQLGYPRFGAQGGDWGAGISTWMARNAPERLIGLHLNYIPGSFRPWVEGEATLSAEERGFLSDKADWSEEEGAYGHVQATRPGTLGIALTDSPAGLAAWILEKVRAWADCDGDVEARFSLDELLANVTLYWVTNTAASSLRLYRESKLTPLQLGPGERIRVPMGFARFPARGAVTAQALGGARVRGPSVDGDAAWRPLRRLGGAGASGTGHPGVLPPLQRCLTLTDPHFSCEQ